jgi:hypothetical protein
MRFLCKWHLCISSGSCVHYVCPVASRALPGEGCNELFTRLPQVMRIFCLSGHIPSEASNESYSKLWYLTNRASLVPDRPVRVWLTAHGGHLDYSWIAFALNTCKLSGAHALLPHGKPVMCSVSVFPEFMRAETPIFRRNFGRRWSPSESWKAPACSDSWLQCSGSRSRSSSEELEAAEAILRSTEPAWAWLRGFIHQHASIRPAVGG